MKALRPWVCLFSATTVSLLHAAEGLESYRRGDYFQAALQFQGETQKNPMVNYYLGLMRLYGYGELKNNLMALQYFTAAGEKGHLGAQKLLANYYLNAAEDPERALIWFKKAAALNDIPAQMYVAGAYLFGYGTKPNEDIARRYYIDAAKNGNAIAQYTLADNFLNSKSQQNKKMGLIWLQKAVDQGNLDARHQMAKLYAFGGLVSPDVLKANALLEALVKMDYLPAIATLGEMAIKSGDFEKAKSWLTKAADQGNADAQYQLALLTLDEKSPFYNVDSGFLWMLKAAQNGKTAAELALAKIYREGKIRPKDTGLADEWERAAKKPQEKPTKATKIALARWLSAGKRDSLMEKPYQLEGIFKSWQDKEALKEDIYNQSPDRRQISAVEVYRPHYVMTKPLEIPIADYFDVLAPNIGTNRSAAWTFPRYDFDTQIDAVLHDGFWVVKHDPHMPLVERTTPYQSLDEAQRPVDYFDEKTRGWEYKANLQMALNNLYEQAILGESSAQFELGQLYQYGVGVAKNVEQAISYFELAAAQQDIRAEYNLGLLYLEGQTNPINYQKGMEWMTDAAFKGNAYAQYVLANMYENGFVDPQGVEIVPADHEQALAMYYLAASNNYGEAQYRLADYLIKEKQTGLGGIAKENREKLIKRLYQNAVAQGVADAVLPLAFYDAMDPNPDKQHQAFAFAKKEAAEGNPEAALLLGMMLERGIASSPNREEAIHWYQKAGLSNPVTAFILGTYYSLGEGLDKDLSKGQSLLEKSAHTGFSYADLNLAILKQQQGQPFTEELNQARQLGNGKAGLLLADTYLLNSNPLEAMKEAGQIYQYFAERGNKDAQMKLGFYFDKGLNGEANPVLAAQWYTLAAKQGQALAQYLLADLYQLGKINGVPDYLEAKRWYKLASKQYAPALVALGFVYDTVDNNYGLAKKYDHMGLDSLDPLAQFNLGLIYEYGKGEAVNVPQAFQLYKSAAHKGHVKAMTQLAGLYAKGVEGTADYPKALSWYKKAASFGDNGALYYLGEWAEKGKGASINYPNAFKYYQESYSKGNERAALALARMYQNGLGTPKDSLKAAEIYKQLVANKNAYAAYQLGNFYLNGELGEINKQAGMLLLQQARDFGNNQAGIQLQRLQAQTQPNISFIEPLYYPI